MKLSEWLRLLIFKDVQGNWWLRSAPEESAGEVLQRIAEAKELERKAERISKHCQDIQDNAAMPAASWEIGRENCREEPHQITVNLHGLSDDSKAEIAKYVRRVLRQHWPMFQFREETGDEPWIKMEVVVKQ